MTTTSANGDVPRSTLAGLLGQGITSSLTPEMHEREARRQGIRYVYKIVDLGDDQVDHQHLSRLLEFAVELGFDGLNVTHPIKQAMVPLMDRVTAEVTAIGALNTVLIADGQSVGHNTDVTGFARAFREGFPDAALDEVVLLGAGGAGAAVAHALIGLGTKRLLVCDHDDSRAEALVRSTRLSAEVAMRRLEAAELPNALPQASGLVNATPVGMFAHPGLPVPDAELLHPNLWVADIVYRPLVTQLLSTASSRGCRTLNGAGMAVHQAADTFELITGRTADRGAMFRDFDELVAAEDNESVHLATPGGDPPQKGIRNASS